MDFDTEDYYIEDLSPTHYRALKIKEVLFESQSPYQSIRVLDTHDFGRILVLDDTVQTAESDEHIYHEVLVHPPVLVRGEVKSVLVIGGGDGGMIEEVCKHPKIETIEMVELDAMVVDASQEFLKCICGNAFDDPRVSLIVSDGRKHVESTASKYDVIILDLTDPIGPSKALYTREFYGALKGALRPGGIVATHCGGWFTYPKVASTIVNTFEQVFSHVETFPCFIPSYGMELAFLYSSDEVDFAALTERDFRVSLERFAGRRDLGYLSEEFIYQMKLRSRLFQQSIRSTDRVSSDENPFEFTEFYEWERSG